MYTGVYLFVAWESCAYRHEKVSDWGAKICRFMDYVVKVKNFIVMLSL